MIAFVGSVFSPYYHWSGRRDPENHVAFNLALYQPRRPVWTMTERGKASLARSDRHLVIGPSSLRRSEGRLDITFAETALPWPGQRWWPERVSGSIRIEWDAENSAAFDLDPDGRHQWMPVAPKARATLRCDAVPDGGWQGHAYVDLNAGSRPVETDFEGWDWARGVAEDGDTMLLYDCRLADGTRQAFGLAVGPDGAPHATDCPAPAPLPAGFWGVAGSVACDPGVWPSLIRRFEDTPFYTRSLVATTIAGKPVQLIHETLSCRRLANPLVRLMLPFRMPRRTAR